MTVTVAMQRTGSFSGGRATARGVGIQLMAKVNGCVASTSAWSTASMIPWGTGMTPTENKRAMMRTLPRSLGWTVTLDGTV